VKSLQSVLIRSTSGGFEPRFKSAEEFLLRFTNSVEPIIWSRTVKDFIFVDANSANIFKVHAGYGRGVKNLLSHFQFFLFIVRRLRKIKPKLIYACDLDTLIPSLLWRRNKRVVIIFDQFDPLSSRTNNRILSHLIDKLEIYFAKKADIKITANSLRIPALFRDDWFELLNVFKVDVSDEISQETRSPLVLFYGGILSPDRGLLACAAAVSQEPDWEFHLYGQGSTSEQLKNSSYPNVFVHEPIPHNELMRIAANSDLFLAMYDPKQSNNKFTASNKLFEAAQLGIPLMTSKNTQLGQIVKDNHLGWIVEYDDPIDISSALTECRNMNLEEKVETRKNLNSFSTKQFRDRQETVKRIFEILAKGLAD